MFIYLIYVVTTSSLIRTSQSLLFLQFAETKSNPFESQLCVCNILPLSQFRLRGRLSRGLSHKSPSTWSLILTGRVTGPVNRWTSLCESGCLLSHSSSHYYSINQRSGDICSHLNPVKNRLITPGRGPCINSEPVVVVVLGMEQWRFLAATFRCE